MKVVLAEKPSVARDLAAVLGARTRREGFLEGNGYRVTWAFGHLVALKEPDDYDPRLKRWTLEDLPIIPEEFALKLTGDDGARKQYETVAGLFRAADELICATDAGREGELIFRYILRMSGCTDKPFRRLWLSSLTEAAIRAGFAALADGREFDDLYAAARCRSEADWIVGMNATRNYTVRFGQAGVLWSVGRVQTPVLALIVARDDEIRYFVAAPWYEVRTRYRDVVFKLRGDRFTARPDADAVVAAVTGVPLTVTAVATREEQDRPPQLFDLTALQREMNLRHGMSAADVLKEAQTLYEGKLITYPRTDSRYLPRDMHREVGEVLGQLRGSFPAVQELDLAKLPVDKRVFDDAKVTDHHAIIPTGRTPGGLHGAARRIYEAIAVRTIAVFYPPCRKAVTTVDAVVGSHKFFARGIRVTDPGWTVLYPKKKAGGGESAKGGDDPGGGETAKVGDDPGDDEEDRQELPAFEKGESGPHRPEVKVGETRPPRHYTENSLLAAMETAGRLVEDEELKEALKARGLGTPATRANIIETLLRRSYIERQRKSLVATDLGRYLIGLIQNPILKSPEMTGEWEARLRDIEGGKLDPQAFMGEIERFTREVIDGGEGIDPGVIGPCPRCAGPIVEGRRGYGCSRWKDGCEYVLWKEYEGQQISLRQARELFQRGLSTRPVRIGDRPVVLALTPSGEATALGAPRREHQRGGVGTGVKRSRAKASGPKGSGAAGAGAPRSLAKGAGAKGGGAKGGGRTRSTRTAPSPTCPLCGGPMVEREDAYSCAAWRAGCRFAIAKQIAGKKISKAMARKLLTKGRTQVLKGFTSKSNQPFDARLKLEEGRVRFELGE